MNERQWVDGPPGQVQKGGYRGRWVALVDELRKHPGEWTYEVVDTPAQGYTTTSGLVRGTLGGVERGQIEAVTRQVDGEVRVYARWIGES